MTTTFATISVLMGVLMLASKSRKRFPCFAGACCALLAGGFIMGLPILNSIQILGWICFCVWVAALPSLLACVIALGVLASREKVTVSCVAFGVVAVLANIQPAFDFWSAAASGVVDATPVLKKTNTSWVVAADSIKDEGKREAVIAATTSLATTPTDMPALETLLQCLGPEVVNAVGVNTYYTFTDPVKKKADAVLSVWYSTDFLTKVLEEGSDLATYWSLRKIRHQEINSYEGWKDGRRELSTSPDLIARKALVTPDVKRALIPTLKHLMQSPDKQTADFAADMVKDFGLLIDRKSFLESLADPDEQKVAKALSEMMETTSIDPLLTEEIWGRLNAAETDYLKYTCLRYPWLLEIKTFDAAKQRTLVHLLEDFSNGIGTNLNTALILLAHSDNPSAERILQSLASCDSEAASARMNKYVQIYEDKHGRSEQPAAHLQSEGVPSD